MTPMPNAPSPNAIFGQALARTPAPLPLSTVEQQMAQTAGLNAQVPIQQQTAQELALKNQLTRRAITNANLIRDNAGTLLQASGGKWDDSVRNGLIAKGVDPDEAEKVTNAHYVNDEAFARTSQIREAAIKTHQENIDHANTQAAKIAVSLQQALKPDGSLDLPMLEAQLQNVKQQNPDYDGDYVRGLAKDPEKFKAVMGGAIARAPDVSQAQQEILKTHAQSQLLGGQAEEASAAARKTRAEAAMSERELKLMEGAFQSPAAMGDSIDQLIDPKKYPEINARTRNEFPIAMMMGGPKAAQQVLTSAVTHINSLEEGVSKATNPQIVQTDVDKEIRTRVGVQRALAGSGIFSSITDPAARAAAMRDTEKVDMDYADKIGGARQLRDFINLAQQNGNKAAPGMIGIAELRTLLNRITRQELQAVGPGAGDAWDRIQGFTGKWIAGQPIPPDILRDTKILGGAMEAAAKRTRDLKAQTIGKNYGIAPPPPIVVPAAEAATPAPGGPPLITTKAAFDALPKGAVYKERDGNTYTKP